MYTVKTEAEIINKMKNIEEILRVNGPRKTAIVLHHSATADGSTYSWPAIRTYHTSYRYNGTIIDKATANEYIKEGKKVELPWKDIGYHFGIEQVDGQWNWSGGRMPLDQGAHCPEGNMNEIGLGICFVGNFDLTEPPAEMITVGVNLISQICLFGGIEPDAIQGHHFYNPHKSCPGARFDVTAFREAVKIKCQQIIASRNR